MTPIAMVYLSTPLNASDLQLAIVRSPLTIGPEVSVTVAIATMSGGHTSCTTQTSCTPQQPSGQSVSPSLGHDPSVAQNTEHPHTDVHQSIRSSCVVVLEGEKVIGILTERDVVRLSAQEMAFDQVQVRDVMAHPVVTLQETDFTDIFSAINLLQQKRIRHLPLLDQGNRLVGLLTHESLQRLTRPIDLLRFRMAQEVMTREVVQATPETSMLAIAQRMAQHRVSSVVIVEAATASISPTGEDSDRETPAIPAAPSAKVPPDHPTHIPVGIITERDLVQCQALGLCLGTHRVSTVMSTPIFTVHPEESLWTVQHLMEHRRIQRVVVVEEGGRLAGIITQSSVLQALNPLSIYQLAETLEIRVQQLEAEKLALQQASTHTQLQLELASRRQTEEKLHASEQRYASLVAASPVGILRTDCLGICTYANERYCQMVGLAPELLIGQPWSTGHHSDDIQRIRAEYEQSVREYRPCHIEYRLQRTDGQVTWVYGQAVAEWDTTGQQIGFVGTVTDISDRKAAESLLASQNQILERIAKGEPLPTVLDTLLHSMEGYLSGSVCTITLCQDGRLGEVTAPSLPPAYAVAVTETNLPIAEGAGSCGTAAFRRELVVVTDIANDPLWQAYKASVLCYGLQACSSVPIFGSDRTLLGVFGIYYREQKAPHAQELEWIAQAANIAGIAIERDRATQALQQLNQDLEHRVAERTVALQASEERWQLALKGSNDGVWDWNPETGQLFLSERLKGMRGFSNNELHSLDECLELIHPDDRDQVCFAMEKHLSGQTEFFEIEYRVLHQDGSYIWVLNRAQAQRDELGRAIRMSGSETDITARKQAELALREHEQFLQTVLDTFPLSVFWKDMNSVYLGCNQNFLRDAGLQSVEQIIGKMDYELAWGETEADLYRADDRAVIESQIAKLGIEEPQHQADGKTIWVETNKLPLRNLQGDVIGVLGTYQDISDRKAAEQRLRDLSERLEIALKGANIGIWEWQIADNRLLWDDRMYALYGIEPEEFGEDYQDWLQRVHPDDRDQVQRIEQQALNGDRNGDAEFRIVHPDGTIRFISSSALIQRNLQGEVQRSIGLNIDITNRKQAELDLEKSRQKYYTLLQSVNGIVWDYDLESKKFTFVSGKAEALLGYPISQWLSEANFWRNHVYADDLEEADRQFQLALQEQRNYELEYRMVAADGHLVWVSDISSIQFRADGSPFGVTGIFIDISDRKQAEFALNQEALRRSTIFNASPDGIHILNRAGQLIEANESFARMLGYSLPEALELNVADWDAQWTPEELQDILQTYSHTHWTFETLHRRKDGSVFPVEISECAMEWNGEFALVCISRDISERRQAAQQLELTNAELLRATRLKDEFLANMSHELRTPLNAILGMSEVLQEGLLGPINDRQRQSLKTIERSGSHLLELINDILDVAKIEAGQLSLDYAPTAIASLCQTSLTFIRQQAQKKRIQLNSQIPPNLPLLDLDERRIRQVLLNLLNNAVKFTPEEGSITLAVLFPFPPEAPAKPSAPEPNTPSTQWLRITVTDTGIGIAPDHIPRLFQPFIQIDSALNRQYDGTGLGLALVKRIIELHGGQVGLSSEVGVGSCFSIDLPYTPSSPSLPYSNQLDPSPDPDPAPQLSPPSHTPHPPAPLILIAEDNEANLSTLSNYLEAKGYRLVFARNGEEAIAIATPPSERPALILMDIQMPGMDGLAAIQVLRQDPDLSAIPIIALTALAMEGDRDRCLAAGATEYLSKPLKLNQLSLLIQQYLSPNVTTQPTLTLNPSP